MTDDMEVLTIETNSDQPDEVTKGHSETISAWTLLSVSTVDNPIPNQNFNGNGDEAEADKATENEGGDTPVEEVEVINVGKTKISVPAKAKVKEQVSTSYSKCVNCDKTFNSRSGQITEIQVGYCFENEDEDKLTDCSKMYLVDAVYSVFSTDNETVQDDKLRLAGFCIKCAKVASQLYGHFNTLLNFSTPTAPISQSILQFKNWHSKNSVTPTNGTATLEENPHEEDLHTDTSQMEQENVPEISVNESEQPSTDEAAGVAEIVSENLENGNPEVESKEAVPVRKSTRERKKNQRFDTDSTESPTNSPNAKDRANMNKRVKLDIVESPVPVVEYSERARRSASIKTPAPTPTSSPINTKGKKSPAARKDTSRPTTPKSEGRRRR